MSLMNKRQNFQTGEGHRVAIYVWEGLQMSNDVKYNKLRNEEFKMWKKSVPLLYQHISTIKPNYTNAMEQSSRKGIAISPNVDLDTYKQQGLLESHVLCSSDENIYQLRCPLPIGLYSNGSSKETSYTDPNYNIGISDKVVPPQWVFSQEQIFKICVVKSTVLAMTEKGSIGWFNESQRDPIHKISNGNEVKALDLCCTNDGNVVVESIGNNQNTGVLQIRDNAGKMGDILRSIDVPSPVSTISFFDNNTFTTCSVDSVVRVWDTRNSDQREVLVLPGEECSTVATSRFVDTVFATGSSNGDLKIWDIRSLLATESEPSNLMPLFALEQKEDDPIIQLQWSPHSAVELISSGGRTGSVYHWNIEELLKSTDPEAQDDSQLAEDALHFLHTGGNRRSTNSAVAYHPILPGVVGTLDNDGIVTVYKPYEPAKNAENSQEAEHSAE